MGNRYPKIIWNYSDIFAKEEHKVKNFQFTNNLCEKINRYLNKYLKNGICSNFLFRSLILSIIEQFENKVMNQINDNKKSDLIKFYIKKMM